MATNPQEKKELLEKTPLLETPAHGNGKLLRGNPGNIGGYGGVSPSLVRERSRGSFYARINTLEKLADTEKVAARDRIKAIDTLGKYGLLTGKLDVQEVQVRLARTIAKLEEMCSPDLAERLIAALSSIWNPAK